MSEIDALRRELDALTDDVELAKECFAIRRELNAIGAEIVAEQLRVRRRNDESKEQQMLLLQRQNSEQSTVALQHASQSKRVISKADRAVILAIRQDLATVAELTMHSSDAATEAFLALAECAKRTPAPICNLRSVALPGVGAGRETIDALVEWLEAAAYVSSVHFVDLETNRIMSDDMTRLSRQLFRLPQLRQLRLVNQQRETINPKARTAMLEAVLAHHTLEKITFDFSSPDRARVDAHLVKCAAANATADANERVAARRAADAAAKALAPPPAPAPAAAPANELDEWRRRAELAEALLKSSNAQHVTDAHLIGQLRREVQALEAINLEQRSSLADAKRENETLSRQLVSAEQSAALARHDIADLQRKLERRRAHSDAAPPAPTPAADTSGSNDRLERIVSQQRAREEAQAAREQAAQAAEHERAEAARLAAIEKTRANLSAQPAPTVECDNRAMWRKTSGGWEAPEVGAVAIANHSNAQHNNYDTPVTETMLPLARLDMLRIRDALQVDASYEAACGALVTLLRQYALTAPKKTVDRLIKLTKLAVAIAHRSVWVIMPDDDADNTEESETSASLSEAANGLALPILSRSVLRATFTLLDGAAAALRWASEQRGLGALSPLIAAASFELTVSKTGQQLLRDADRVQHWRASLERVWTANLRSCLDWGDAPIPRLVLQTIFGNIESVSDLLQCRAVSRAWRNALPDNSEIWLNAIARMRGSRSRSSRTARHDAMYLWSQRGKSDASLGYCQSCGQFVWRFVNGTGLSLPGRDVVTATSQVWHVTSVCEHRAATSIDSAGLVAALIRPPMPSMTTTRPHWLYGFA
jgi:hypothetical protein